MIMKMRAEKEKCVLYSHICELKFHQIFLINFNGTRRLPVTCRISEQ